MTIDLFKRFLLNCPGEGAHNCPRLFTTLSCRRNEIKCIVVQEREREINKVVNKIICRRGSGRSTRISRRRPTNFNAASPLRRPCCAEWQTSAF